MSSSETVTSAGADFFRETVFFGFSPAAALRVEVPRRLPSDFARAAALALGIFERADVSEIVGLPPLGVSLVAEAGAIPPVAASLDFFKFFAIYFCF